jgi:hypothetical protein
VNRVKIEVRGGSHHQHIYRSTDPTRDVPDGVEVCNMAVNFDEWELVLASQSVLLNWKLPRGVAFYFRAHEQLLAQSHFVDNGLLSSPPNGWALYNLYAIPERKVVSYVASFLGQERDVLVPPHSTTSATTRCVPEARQPDRDDGLPPLPRRAYTASLWDGRPPASRCTSRTAISSRSSSATARAS